MNIILILIILIIFFFSFLCRVEYARHKILTISDMDTTHCLIVLPQLQSGHQRPSEKSFHDVCGCVEQITPHFVSLTCLSCNLGRTRHYLV